jgi:starvation-inducible DNA-binding protein
MHYDKTEIAKKLAELLSDIVTAKFILQGYHWNVLGPDFGEYHKYFAELYTDLDSSIDPTAENILKVGFPSPYLLTDFVEMSCIKEERQDGTSTQFMLQSALRILTKLHDSHCEAYEKADECNLQGLADFLAGRVDVYAKWIWQTKAYLGVR